jgi:hypothetical protein
VQVVVLGAVLGYVSSVWFSCLLRWTNQPTQWMLDFRGAQVPRNLQAALPFKSKPKNQSKQKDKTYEQKRAVVLEKEEKAAVTLMQQLNTIRAAKAKKRTETQTRRRAEHEKKRAKEAAGRAVHTKVSSAAAEGLAAGVFSGRLS